MYIAHPHPHRSLRLNSRSHGKLRKYFLDKVNRMYGLFGKAVSCGAQLNLMESSMAAGRERKKTPLNDQHQTHYSNKATTATEATTNNTTSWSKGGTAPHDWYDTLAICSCKKAKKLSGFSQIFTQAFGGNLCERNKRNHFHSDQTHVDTPQNHYEWRCRRNVVISESKCNCKWSATVVLISAHLELENHLWLVIDFRTDI